MHDKLVEKLKTLTIQTYTTNQEFNVVPQSSASLMDIVNEKYDEPKRQGIPFLCKKGVCRNCVVKVLSNEDLLKSPIKAERMSLSVGKTTIDNGYRLACLAHFE